MTREGFLSNIMNHYNMPEDVQLKIITTVIHGYSKCHACCRLDMTCLKPKDKGCEYFLPGPEHDTEI